MNSRVVGALLVVLVFGGGIVTFILVRANAERESLIADAVRATDSELSGSVVDPEALRLVLRNVRKTRETLPSSALELAEARILVALGRTQEAWELARPLATDPAAPTDAMLIGARILLALQAGTGSEQDGRQALALADAHFRATSSIESGFLAWQAAFRVGDAARWSELSVELGAVDGDGIDAARVEVVRAMTRELAGFLADRLGVPRDQIREGAEDVVGDLARAQASAPTAAVSASRIDEIAGRFTEVPPELELGAAVRILDAVSSRQGAAARDPEVEGMLRDAVDRTDRLLSELPTSIEGRHLAVVALIGMRQAFGLDPDELSRYRGHLQWLIANAPPTHVQRAVWQRLDAEFR